MSKRLSVLSPPRLIATLGTLLLSLAATGQVTAEPVRLLAVKSIEAPIYNQVISAMQSRLAEVCSEPCQQEIELVVTTVENLPSAGAADLYLPIGRLAALAVAENAPPAAIYGLIPEATWEEIHACCPNAWHPRSTAVFLDQPLSRQLNLVRQVLPESKRIAVLYGPTSSRWREKLSRLAENAGIELVTQEIQQDWEVGPALDILLDDVDALLALPDPSVYNRETLYGVLLTTYRKGVPVFGYARSLSQAGAVAVVYSSPQNVGRQLVDKALYYIQHDRKLPPPAPLDEFEVKVNKRVLRSLGLVTPSAAKIYSKLREMEQ